MDLDLVGLPGAGSESVIGSLGMEMAALGANIVGCSRQRISFDVSLRSNMCRVAGNSLNSVQPCLPALSNQHLGINDSVFLNMDMVLSVQGWEDTMRGSRDRVYLHIYSNIGEAASGTTSANQRSLLFLKTSELADR